MQPADDQRRTIREQPVPQREPVQRPCRPVLERFGGSTLFQLLQDEVRHRNAGQSQGVQHHGRWQHERFSRQLDAHVLADGSQRIQLRLGLCRWVARIQRVDRWRAHSSGHPEHQRAGPELGHQPGLGASGVHPEQLQLAERRHGSQGQPLSEIRRERLVGRRRRAVQRHLRTGRAGLQQLGRPGHRSTVHAKRTEDRSADRRGGSRRLRAPAQHLGLLRSGRMEGHATVDTDVRGSLGRLRKHHAQPRKRRSARQPVPSAAVLLSQLRRQHQRGVCASARGIHGRRNLRGPRHKQHLSAGGLRLGPVRQRLVDDSRRFRDVSRLDPAGRGEPSSWQPAGVDRPVGSPRRPQLSRPHLLPGEAVGIPVRVGTAAVLRVGVGRARGASRCSGRGRRY